MQGEIVGFVGPEPDASPRAGFALPFQPSAAPDECALPLRNQFGSSGRALQRQLSAPLPHLGPSRRVDHLPELARDMEPVRHVQRLPGPLPDRGQASLPRIRADHPQALRTLLAEPLGEALERLDPALLADPHPINGPPCRGNDLRIHLRIQARNSAGTGGWETPRWPAACSTAWCIPLAESPRKAQDADGLAAPEESSTVTARTGLVGSCGHADGARRRRGSQLPRSGGVRWTEARGAGPSPAPR